MKKHFILATAMTALLSATSCSKEDSVTNETDANGKTRIALSGTDGQMAVTRAGFTAQTRIVARIVSDKRDGSESKCVKTSLSAKAQTSSTYSGFSDVEYVTGNVRYWDDAHGRNSRLSVYAIAIPDNYTDTEGNKLDNCELKGTSEWATTNATDNTMSWTVSTSQTESLLAAEDLAFSNNIQETGDKGVYTYNYSEGKYPTPTFDEGQTNASRHSYEQDGTKYDGRLYFTQQGKGIKDAVTDDPGHFDKGQMEFTHALTRIQVNLKKGDGYTAGDLNVTAIQLLNQPYKGTFNIQSGAWTVPTAGDIGMAKKAATTAGQDATYESQVLPGYAFVADDNNALSITVNGNTYFITNNMLRTALDGKTGVNAGFSTERGKRYIFNIVVQKNKIENITATIVDWNDITAEKTTVDNSHLTFTFYKDGNPCTDIKLFKYEQDLGDVYTDDSYSELAKAVAGSEYSVVNGLTQVAETNKFTTSEFYKDNQTAYHFRSTNAATNLNAGNTNFTMTSGKATTANDYHWGAPMKTSVSTDKLPYSETVGYLNSIEKGIVAANTENADNYINLTEVHMMSQLVIKLKSESSDDNAKVTLEDATVKLTKISKTGTVDMGSGKITPADSHTDLDAVTVELESKADPSDPDIYSCTINVVPQDLVRGDGDSDDDYIGITIHTTDNNEYYVVKHLSEILANSIGSQVTNMQAEGGAIKKWFPGHRYTYTFNITKTEIKNITATIVGWNEIVAGETNLDLEK